MHDTQPFRVGSTAVRCVSLRQKLTMRKGNHSHSIDQQYQLTWA
ncbi:hypothetical protein NB574_20200 [Vibrio vulnificus]|nr:hypothetical protein [Vibrio vulnificus]